MANIAGVEVWTGSGAGSTATPTPTATRTPTRTPTITATGAFTATPTRTPTITPTASGTGSLYRAINIGGPGLTINSETWESNIEAAGPAPLVAVTVDFTSEGTWDCNQWLTLNPAASSTQQGDMLKCWREHWAHNMTMSAVPAGQYDVFLYVIQSWTEPNPATFSVLVQGATCTTHNMGSTAGRWWKLGPCRTTVSGSTLTVAISGASVMVAGLEVRRTQQATPTPTATPPMTSTPLPAGLAPVATLFEAQQTQDVIVFLCEFDFLGPIAQPSQWFQKVFSPSYPSSAHFWNQQSFGNTTLNVRYMPNTKIDVEAAYHLPPGTNHRNFLWGKAVDDCYNGTNGKPPVNSTTSLDIRDLQTRQSSILVYLFNGKLEGPGAVVPESAFFTYRNLPGTTSNYVRMVVLPSKAFDRNSGGGVLTLTHELGHALGLHHTYGYEIITRNDLRWDVMSQAENSFLAFDAVAYYVNTGTLGFGRYLTGWIPVAQSAVVQRNRSALIDLQPLHIQQNNSTRLGIIPIPNTSEFFIVEARSGLGGTGTYDDLLLTPVPGLVPPIPNPPGTVVLIYRVREIPIDNGYGWTAQLVDIDNNQIVNGTTIGYYCRSWKGSDPNDAGSSWDTTRVFFDHLSNVEVRIVSIAVSSVRVEIRNGNSTLPAPPGGC